MQLSSFQAFHSRITIIVVSVMLLAGCGFHIKRTEGLADKYPQVFIQSGAPNGDLVRFVKMRLRGSGIEIVNTPTALATILKIGSVSSSSRTISLYIDATSAETEKGYSMTYSIQRPGFIAKSFNFNLYRDFLESADEALAKSRESELLTKEMNSIAADQILATMLSQKQEELIKIEDSE